jgi:hypothetical protein
MHPSTNDDLKKLTDELLGTQDHHHHPLDNQQPMVA